MAVLRFWNRTGHALVSHVLINRENSGSTFQQWNTGVSLAKGDFIWFAESDDLADKHFLKTLLPDLISNPEVMLAYCQSTTIDADGNVTGSMEDWTRELDAPRWSSRYEAYGEKEIRQYILRKSTIPNASAVVFR